MAIKIFFALENIVVKRKGTDEDFKLVAEHFG